MPNRRRRRRRRLTRTPHRAARQAASSRAPRAVELAYQQALRRVAGAIAEAMWKILEPRIADFAAPDPETRTDAPPPSDGDVGGVVKALMASVTRILDGTSSEVDRASKVAAGRIVEHSKREFARLGIRLLDAEPNMGKEIVRWRKVNADRIVTMGQAKIERVEELLKNKAGMRVETLRKTIQEQIGTTKAHAALIARDQVLKLNAQVTEARHVAAGITEYVWTCSGDERVRGRPDGLYPDAKPSHWELDGKRFRWDKPPIIGANGERGHPGEYFQCRCTAYPILPELEDDA